MTKAEQAKINAAVEAVSAEVRRCMRADGTASFSYRPSDETRLRNCTAWVGKAGRYYVLRSYNTVIAAIDPYSDTLYDFLREVYGYTATSAQHIAKFDRDYGGGKWGCAHRLTWRDI